MSDTSDGESRGFFINLGDVHCPSCGEQMPAIRVPDSIGRLLWGGWKCPQCGCEMDRWGKAVGGPGAPA